MLGEKEDLTKHILAADIGGTNSRFAHFISDGSTLTVAARRWIKTESVSSLAQLFAALGEDGFTLTPSSADMVVLAVAGPVLGGNYTNPPWISWDIDLRNAEADFGIRKFLLINDFVAQAYACRSAVGAQAETVLAGRRDEAGTVGVIGAGTNLGKAMLVPVVRASGRSHYVAVPSEGGHASFPVESPDEAKFAAFLADKLRVPYVTCENVISGKGISFVHEFLTGEVLDPAEVTAGWQNLAEDSTTSESLLWCAGLYGRVCRNFALETLALGGIYIAGGVVAKCPILARHRAFAQEFRSSPKHGSLLANIPVLVIKDEESGLWGAAFAGFQELL